MIPRGVYLCHYLCFSSRLLCVVVQVLEEVFFVSAVAVELLVCAQHKLCLIFKYFPRKIDSLMNMVPAICFLLCSHSVLLRRLKPKKVKALSLYNDTLDDSLST